MVITEADLTAMYGRTETVTSYSVTGATAGQATPLINLSGANRNWDMSAFSWTQGDVSTQTWVSPADGLTGFGAFPTADYAIVTDPAGADFTNVFFDLQPGLVNTLGTQALQGGVDFNQTYTPPLIANPLPMTFGSAWNGVSTYTGFIEGVGNVVITQENTGNVDGWGTITLPNGTFECLRYSLEVKVTTQGVTTTTTIYTWVIAGLAQAATITETTITVPFVGTITNYAIGYSNRVPAAPAAPADAPAGLSPCDGCVDVSVTPTLTWNAVSGATTYEVQVATDAGFASIVASQTGLASGSYAPAGLAEGTTYFWRARGSNAGGTGPWASASFTTLVTPTAPSAAPSGLVPCNGCVDVSATPTLTWNAVSGAATYEVQVATDAGFASIVASQTGLATASFAPAGLAEGTTYHWRVRGTNDVGPGPWASASFTTLVTPTAPSAAPSGLVPLQGAVDLPTVLTMAWGEVVGATTYEIEIATDAGFASIVESGSGLVVRTYSPTALSGGTTYYWRIRGVNDVGPGPWTTQSFATVSGVAVERIGDVVPTEFELFANYPNPFNPTTRFRFALAESSKVRLTIYSMLGQAVEVLIDGSLPAGTHEVSFEAGSLPSGPYLYRLEAGSYVESRVMTLLR